MQATLPLLIYVALLLYESLIWPRYNCYINSLLAGSTTIWQYLWQIFDQFLCKFLFIHRRSSMYLCCTQAVTLQSLLHIEEIKWLCFSSLFYTHGFSHWSMHLVSIPLAPGSPFPWHLVSSKCFYLPLPLWIGVHNVPQWELVHLFMTQMKNGKIIHTLIQPFAIINIYICWTSVITRFHTRRCKYSGFLTNWMSPEVAHLYNVLACQLCFYQTYI